MLKFDVLVSNQYEDEQTLTCPICGHWGNHIQSVGTLMGDDIGEAEVYEGTVEIGKAEFRRSGLAVNVECEGGCKWQLVLQQHKGNLFLQAFVDQKDYNEALEIIKEQNEELDYILGYYPIDGEFLGYYPIDGEFDEL